MIRKSMSMTVKISVVRSIFEGLLRTRGDLECSGDRSSGVWAMISLLESEERRPSQSVPFRSIDVYVSRKNGEACKAWRPEAGVTGAHLSGEKVPTCSSHLRSEETGSRSSPSSSPGLTLNLPSSLPTTALFNYNNYVILTFKFWRNCS